MKGGEPVALRAHLGEKQRLEQFGMGLGRDADGLEDDARAGQLGVEAHRLDLRAPHGDGPGHALEGLSRTGAVSVLELRELRHVEPADVGAAPLLVDAAGHGQALEYVERIAPALEQPVGFAVERGDLLHALKGESHGQPTEPSISSWMRRFSSTAYSRGSSLVNGSMKPLTIIVSASARGMPRLIR